MTPSSVLVVKPSSLGDIVHTLPAVHYLKVTFPEAKISWIANTEWVPLLEENADLKTVIPFPRREFRGPVGIFKFVRWCRGLSGLKPDLVLDFQGLFRSAWISRSAKGKSVFGLSDSREGVPILLRPASPRPSRSALCRSLSGTGQTRRGRHLWTDPIPSSTRESDPIARIAGAFRRPAPVCARSSTNH